jgi:hypothetical protein
LFPSDLSYSNKNHPLIFSDSCNEEYEAWIERYNMTMNQLLNKEEITEYKTLKNFAEDYCCYTGKYNATLFYTSQEGFNKELMNYCDKKSISSSPPKKIKTLFSFLWNRIRGRRSEMMSVGSFKFPKVFAKEPLLIEPMSYFTIGPLVYVPTNVTNHSAMIFIKNNLTVLYSLKLKGETGIGTLKFVEETNMIAQINKAIDVFPKEHLTLLKQTNSELEYKITQDDLLIFNNRLFKKENPVFQVRKLQARLFTLRNIGNMPLIITGIRINNRPCKAYGIQIIDCNNFTLEPTAEHILKIYYSTNLVFSQARYQLAFNTLSGTQTFDLVIKISNGLLEAIQSLSTTDRYLYFKVVVNIM